MLNRKDNYINFAIYVFSAFASLIFTCQFYYTDFSSRMMSIFLIIIITFMLIFVWYVISTTITKYFRQYHRYYSSKRYDKYLYYRPLFIRLLNSLIVISVIILGSQLNINNTIKSSITFLIAIFIITLYMTSLFIKYYAYCNMRKRIREIIFKQMMNKLKEKYYEKDLIKNINKKKLIKHINHDLINVSKKDKQYMISKVIKDKSI